MKKLSRVDDVYLGSQPDGDDLRLLQEEGVQTIINLRHESEMDGFDERHAVEELGMTYVHIPFNGAHELTDEILEASRHQLRTAKRPLLLHCASSNRVGAVWLVYRVQDTGLDYEAALEEAKIAGLRSAGYIERAREYIDH
jgi:uncharacterized protein (TIGR01244 family)